jgi:hypothetical protein
MAGVSLEFILMIGYAAFLAIIALVLEWAMRHSHRRSLGVSTAGFTYHPDRDIWRCPQDQHLFPIFSDSLKGVVVYRAPAAACNSCMSKEACTDSHHGRAIERKTLTGLEYGIQRFHRAISLTLLVLASLILIVELFRASGPYPRIALLAVIASFCLIVERLCKNLSQCSPTKGPHDAGG